jgi:hypothetical protein
MFALLTLPRGVPIDPEAEAPPDAPPAGIVIRPGPTPRRVPLREVFSVTRPAGV